MKIKRLQLLQPDAVSSVITVYYESYNFLLVLHVIAIRTETDDLEDQNPPYLISFISRCCCLKLTSLLGFPLCPSDFCNFLSSAMAL